jgi:hypothetical protein
MSASPASLAVIDTPINLKQNKEERLEMDEWFLVAVGLVVLGILLDVIWKI